MVSGECGNGKEYGSDHLVGEYIHGDYYTPISLGFSASIVV